MDNVRNHFGDQITFVENQYDVLDNKDALLIATEWGAFRNPDFDVIKTRLKEAKVFDGRNLFDLDEMKGMGIYYESIGRATIIG